MSNLQAKGISDLWKPEQKNMLAALQAPGVIPAKYMRIKKVDDADKQSKQLFTIVLDNLLTQLTELLDGLLPVLICTPPTSLSEQPRKIYYCCQYTDIFPFFLFYYL